jgi:hypothetical protein
MEIKRISPLEVRAHLDGTWTTLRPMEFEIEDRGTLIVPAGFNTDLASVPRMFWNILPPFGAYEEGAVGHDLIYRSGGGMTNIGTFTRAEADDFLAACMEFCECPRWQRVAIYRALRLFGSRNFK